MGFDAKINLWADGVAVAPDPPTSGTSLTLFDGSLLPEPEPYNLVVFAAGEMPNYTNAEIIRVTSRIGNVLMVQRAQEGSTARAIQVDDMVIMAPTVKTITDLESCVITHGDTAKTTPVDADEMGLLDSAAAWAKKVLSWGNLKTALKSYFDGIYAAIGHSHTGTYAPASHAGQHQHGGTDEVGTATPTANAIPKADANAKLDGWVTADAAAGTASLRRLGTGATDACAGNDSRLSDARTPTQHAASHAPGQADSIWGQTVPQAVSDSTLVFTFPNPQAGDTAWVQVPYDCYVLAWTVITDGSVTLDVWQNELSYFPPTDANAMPGTGEEPYCDGTDFASAPATNWAVQDIDADCVVMAHVDSASGATFATLQLKVRKYLQ